MLEIVHILLKKLFKQFILSIVVCEHVNFKLKGDISRSGAQELNHVGNYFRSTVQNYKPMLDNKSLPDSQVKVITFHERNEISTPTPKKQQHINLLER